MRRLLFGLVVLLQLVAIQAHPTTLSALILRLRDRAGVSSDTLRAFTNLEAMNWVNDAQGVIIKLGNYLPKQVDISYDEADSLGYLLPTDYRINDRCVLRYGLVWEAVVENPGFAADTDQAAFFVKRKNKDTTLFYIKNVTIPNQTIRLFYRGVATPFTAVTDTVGYQSDRESFVITEAYTYYLESERFFQEAQAVRQQLRQDMGVMRQEDQK